MPRRIGLAPDDSYRVSRSTYNQNNVVLDGVSAPADGWVIRAGVRAGGYRSDTRGENVIYDENFRLMWRSARRVWNNQNKYRIANVPNIRLRRGEGVYIGFWGHPGFERQFAVKTANNRIHQEATSTSISTPDRVPSSSTHSGELMAWLDYVVNHQPQRPQWGSQMPEGLIADFNPVFDFHMPHPDSESAEQGLDFTRAVQIRIVDETLGKVVYNRRIQTNDHERNTQRFTRRVYNHEPGHSYRAIALHEDSWGWRSRWVFNARHYTTNSGPSQPANLSPGFNEKVETLTPNLTADYSHSEGAASSQVQHQLFSGDGSVFLDGTGWTAMAGDSYLHGWTSDFSYALEWGKDYRIRARFKDGAGVVGGYTPKRRFRTNSRPHVPGDLLPQEGAATATALLSCLVRDSDGDDLTRVDFQVRDTATQTDVYAPSKTISGPHSSGSTVTYDASADLTLGTEYEVRAQAGDGTLDSNWTDWQAFVFDNVPAVDWIAPQRGGVTNLVQTPNATHEPEDLADSWWEHSLYASGKNLLTENQSTGGDTLGDATGVTGRAGASASYTTAEAHEGAGAFQVEQTSSTGANSGLSTSNTPAAADRQYVGRVAVKIPAGESVDVRLEFSDSTGFVGQQGSAVQFDATGAWQEIITNPGSVTTDGNVKLSIVTSSGSTMTFYADALQVEEGAEGTAWERGSQGVEKGTVVVADSDAAKGDYCWRTILPIDTDGEERTGVMPISGSQPLAALAWFKAERGDPNGSLWLECRDSAGAVVGTPIYPSSYRAVQDTSVEHYWELYGGIVGQAEIPAGAAEVQMVFSANAQPTEDIVRFDAFVFAELPAGAESGSSYWYGYFDGDYEGFGPEGNYFWTGATGLSASKGLNVVTDPRPDFDFSYSSASGTAKSRDNFRIERWTGSAWTLAHDGGWQTTDRTRIPCPAGVITNEGAYRARVICEDANGLQSGTGWSYFDVDFNGPHELVVLNVGENSSRATLTIEWARTEVPDENFEYYEVSVVSAEEGEVHVGRISDPDTTSYEYPWPVSGRVYDFRIRQAATVAIEEMQSTWQGDDVSVDYFPHYFLKYVDDPETMIAFEPIRGDVPGHSGEAELDEYLPIFGENPMHFTGESRYANGSLVADLWDDPEVDSGPEAQREAVKTMDEGSRFACYLGHLPSSKHFVILKKISYNTTSYLDPKVDLDWTETRYAEDYRVRGDF